MILIDADACPVIDLAIACAGKHGLPVTLICDTCHCLQRDGAMTITVDKGADSADFALVNRITPGDIVITQDYGVAAMALSRKAKVLNQNGLIYTDDNIDALLMSRYTAQKIRRAGGRIKGPAKRTKEQDTQFLLAFESLLNK